ncbi:efflux RND transporter periplasmic adaptor subunit [Litoribacillus peritrichatus]|uniref:Efflux RND transporter periplasmic adaptor subunit n=1 Tax=Litoribacillus peritrichatus TaxID=718191 RepID=A0ABP7N039_9GAMM
MNNKFTYPVLIFVGAIAGALAVNFIPAIYLQEKDEPQSGAMSMEPAAEPEPLYWVAPMDANYRRDEPGLSPMGMELIPVYAEEQGSVDEGPGTIRVKPDVINNLGVRTALVKKSTLHTAIKTVGYVQYNEEQLVHVHPRVEGWIDKLLIKAEGEPVKKGQAMYSIYSPTLVNAQEEMVLALSRNNQRLIQAAKDRLKALQMPESAIKKLIKTRKVLQTVTFYAPQNGVVDNLNIREGFYVKPGTQVMSIGSLEEVWVEAEVFERQAAMVAPDKEVSMTLDYLPGREWTGTVDYVYPTLDPKTRTVKVRMRFANEEGVLKPNMFAQVIIHSESADEALVIPREAVIRTGTQNRVVLALDDGYFKSIEVKLGQLDDQGIVILNGLNEGERVVTSAQFLIDSESSKTSDFKRMEFSQTSDSDESNDMAAESSGLERAGLERAWVEARIESVMLPMEGMRAMVGVTHEPIESWSWPEMYMDFPVVPSVDVSQLKEGMTVHIEINKYPDHSFEINQVHIPDSDMGSMNATEQSTESSGGMQ